MSVEATRSMNSFSGQCVVQYFNISVARPERESPQSSLRWSDPSTTMMEDLKALMERLRASVGHIPILLPYEKEGCDGCEFYCGSIYLRCAVYPDGESKTCPHYMKKV